jgi:hypothetical protein
MTEQANSTEVASTELTQWKNAPTLANLKLDLMDARTTHDAQKTQIGLWLDNLNITGKAQISTPKGNSQIVPKLIRKQAEWRYAALSEPFLSTVDVFNVRPVSYEDRDAAKQNEMVLNSQINTQIDKTRFIDEYIRAAVDEGTVIVRVGWDFQEEEYEGTFPVVEYRVNPELAPLHQHLDQLQKESPSQYASDVPEEVKQAHELTQQQGQPIEAVITGQQTETRKRTVRNAPTLEVCDYRNVIIDPTCMGDLDKAGFLIYNFESSLSELTKSGKYKNLDKVSVSNNSILGEPDHSATNNTNNFNFNDKPRKKFVVFEYWGYWDIDGTGIVKPIVASWVGDTLIRMEESPFPDKKIPFIIEQYLPVRRSIYGEPDGALLEDNQKIIGAVTRGMIDIMGKSANGQTGVRKDALDITNRRKFDKGQDYEFNVNVDPRQGIYMHTFPEIPNSAQFMLQMQNMEAESLTGVKSFSQGVSGSSLGDVAAGVRGALDAASKRELGILRRLSSGIVKIGRKLISMNSEFLSDVEVIRITNEEFVKVRRDDLAGNFDLTLSISTAEEDQNKAQELAFMLQTMGNNMDPSLSKMILSDIARLRKMPDLAKKIESFEPQPDPMQQQKVQMEMALLQAQIATEQSKAALNNAQAQLAGGKIGTEAAKANHLKSGTDLKNLDFIEQESGVKQNRSLQLSGEAAKSNAELATHQHNLDQKDKVNDRLIGDLTGSV